MSLLLAAAIVTALTLFIVLMGGWLFFVFETMARIGNRYGFLAELAFALLAFVLTLTLALWAITNENRWLPTIDRLIDPTTPHTPATPTGGR